MSQSTEVFLDSDEEQLVARARQKDGAAICSIIRRENRRLYRLARSILKSDNDAEDVLQEAYVHAFSNLDGFRGEARLSTWLSRIVINESLSFMRRRKSQEDVSLIDNNPARMAEIIPFPYAISEPDPEATLAQREIRALLESAIDKLPAAFRSVLVARLIEGMSVEETAEFLGILPQTVKTRLHRARHLLRREMEEFIGPVLGTAFPFAGRRCAKLADRVLARLGLS